MTVWDALIGQSRAVAELRRAVEAGDTSAMTHAWLFTGPPGCGRSVAAQAFAAALECGQGGCGVCNSCRTALSGSHPDVTLCRTEQLSIGVDTARELALKAALTPIAGPWQVLVVEDADRLTERAADALLKSLEEPALRTVWVLCAPSADDLPATIRSRTREVRLVTPPDDEVVTLLVSEGVNPDLALTAARAAQGHVGRARALAADAAQRQARNAIIDLPTTWTSLGECLVSAADIVNRAQAEAASQTAQLDAQEKAELDLMLGFGTKGARPRNAATAVSQLEDQQKARAKRLQRDELDNVLTQLATWYRDILALQTGAPPAELINLAVADRATAAAQASTASRTLGCLDAILDARRALDGNVAPLLAIEALFVRLGGFG
ncbi:MAG: DNA polymerase III subunit delta' [Propionibacteriaceae bacterium]|nr:DNA polymerase III subunit delta' [Propionibacteriaceae bacterium]